MSQAQPNQCEDENDWMMVSPPRSRSNSPGERNDDHPGQQTSPADQTQPTNEYLPTLLEEEDDEDDDDDDNPDSQPEGRHNSATSQNDGLTEIDLNVVNSSTSKQTKARRSVRFLNSLRESSSLASSSSSSSSSATAQQENIRPTQAQTKADKTTATTTTTTTTTSNDKPEAKRTNSSLVTTNKTPEAAKQKRPIVKAAKPRPSNQWDITDVLLVGLVCVLVVIYYGYGFYRINSNNSSDIYSVNNNEVGSLAYPEILLLNEELMDCIKRDNLKSLPERGFICYEREKEWRKKFDRLKLEKNLDLAKIIRQTKKKITLNMLQKANPMLEFDLILNQLEYLEYLDQRRKDATIDRLKADNFALRNRLNEKLSKDSLKDNDNNNSNSNSGHQNNNQNSLANVEFENLKLRRENEALKVSLGEKAGTVYVKQSIELEKCERENSALKKFHFQVAQEVAKGLKQLDLKPMDAAAILNDHESLDSQLALTRGYLLRYGEEVGNLIARNKILMDELKETTQLVAARQIDHDQSSAIGDHINNNDTNSSCSLSSYRSSGASSTSDGGGECRPGKLCGEKPNWLMRRAKLRERLRKATGIDVFEKNIEHIIGHNKSQKRHSQHHERKEVKAEKKHADYHNKPSEHNKRIHRHNHHHHQQHHHHHHNNHRFRDEL